VSVSIVVIKFRVEIFPTELYTLGNDLTECDFGSLGCRR
jgi:hypothetical protein